MSTTPPAIAYSACNSVNFSTQRRVRAAGDFFNSIIPFRHAAEVTIRLGWALLDMTMCQKAVARGFCKSLDAIQPVQCNKCVAVCNWVLEEHQKAKAASATVAARLKASVLEEYKNANEASNTVVARLKAFAGRR